MLAREEEKMRILKEQDDKDWNAMQAEYNSSEDDMDDWNEDFSWFDVENDDNYFCLSTKFKNNFQQDR